MSKYKAGLDLVKDELEQIGHAIVMAEKDRDSAQDVLNTEQAQLDALVQMQSDLLKDKVKLEKP